MYRPFILLTDATDGESIAIRCDTITAVSGIPAIEEGPDKREAHTDVEYFDGEESGYYSVTESVVAVVNEIKKLESSTI